MNYKLPLYDIPKPEYEDKYEWKPLYTSFFTNFLSAKGAAWRYKCIKCGWISRDYTDAGWFGGDQLLPLLAKDHPEHPPIRR